MNKRFFRNTLPADLEAIASIASMGVLEPISGLAGIAGTLLPGEKGQGADWVRKVQGMAYEPKNPETLQQIGSALQYPLDMYEKGTDWLGDKGNQIAGPAGGAIGKSLPEILGATFVAGKLLKGAKLPKPSIDDGNFDKSRRELLKKAGIAGGALALGNKFVPDSLPALLDAAPAATTAAKSVASAATKIPAESLFSYRNVAFLKALAGKMGKKEFNKFLVKNNLINKLWLSQ